MRDIRIGNDFTIKWSLYKNDGETRTPYEVTGAAVLKLCSAYGTREVYGWQASGNTIVWTFRGADQRHLGPYQLVYIENEGTPNMMTVDTCDAFCLVSQSCQQSDPSELLMLESDIVFAEVRMIDDELSATSKNAIANKTVTEALGKKVDAVPGKGLSTEDFTTADKRKLQSLENYDDADIKEALNEKQDVIPDLETIRQGAQKGATALQEHQDISHLATKSDTQGKFGLTGFLGELTSENTRINIGSRSIAYLYYTELGLAKIKTISQGSSTVIGGVTGPPVTVYIEVESATRYVKADGLYSGYKIAVYKEVFLGGIVATQEELASKQDAIEDLDAIRSGATLGLTALQPEDKQGLFPMVSVTYADLVAMRDEGRLVPGQQYRIIDFVTTVDQADAKSAGHQFDVIVTADGPSVLNEKARAAISEGDTYFTEAGANLKAWQLWYCLDNDKSRFEWADATNGKGVIYRMIDEWQNDVPYDFKNVVYVNTEEDYAQYTFGVDRVPAADWETAEDESRHSKSTTKRNVMRTYFSSPLKLNANLLLEYCSDNKFDVDCHHNILGNDSSNNIFGYACNENNLSMGTSNYNKFGHRCERNTLGGENGFNYFDSDCCDNVLDYDSSSNTFGFSCREISLSEGCQSNSFANDCANISLGEGASFNSFGRGCLDIILDKKCKNNTLGQDCYDTNIDFNSEYNVIGNNCSVRLGAICIHNKIGNDCSVISLNAECAHNTIGNLCHDITMAGASAYNSIGNYCYRITFRTEEFENNSIGDGCYDIVFGEYVYKLTIAQGCFNLHFESGCYSSSIGSGCHDLEIGDCQRVFIMAGVNGFASSDSSQTYFTDCFICPDGSSFIEIPFRDIKIS